MANSPKSLPEGSLTLTEVIYVDFKPVVVGIDIGLENFGACVFDAETSTIVHFSKFNIDIKPYKSLNFVNLVHSKLWELFSLPALNGRECVVVVEKQLQGNNRGSIFPATMRCNIAEAIIVAFLATMKRDWSIVLVDSKEVRKSFNLPTDRTGKKREAVNITNDMVQNGRCLTAAKEFYLNQAKKDDLADSLLLCLYFLKEE